MFKKFFNSENRYSKFVFIFCCLIFIEVFINNHDYILSQSFKGDSTEYYCYLPAYFIYHDLSFAFKPEINQKYKDHQIWLVPTPNGGQISKTTMGTAILYMPFFFVGHLFAIMTKQAADGYSESYELFVSLGGLFYGLMGLFLLRKILLRFFNDTITAFTIFIIALGTNFFYYSVLLPTRVHVYLFFLFSLFVLAFLNWEKKRTLLNASFIGIIGGLITLMRPTDILLFLLLPFYNVYNYETFIDRIKILLKNYFHLIVMAILFFTTFIPQLIYWKHITGQWFFDCYSKEERFFFLNPHIIDGLFSYRKGWLLYTPMMTFSLIGIYFMYKNFKDFFMPIFIFTILNIYIAFSWWCWWYGGSFGLRSMIQSYILLAIPLACFIAAIKEKYKLVFKAFCTIAVLFICLNLFQSYQYKKGIIHWDGTTKAAYWDSFFALHYTANHKYLIKEPDYDKAKAGEKEY